MVAHCGWRPKWQRIGNQIDTAMIFARSNFVNVHRFDLGKGSRPRKRNNKKSTPEEQQLNRRLRPEKGKI